MENKQLSEKRKTLEQAFYQKEVLRAIENVRLNKSREAQLKEMGRVSKEDKSILLRAFDLGIDAKTYWALTLTPLVEVAWADGTMSTKEREAILSAAEQRGVDEDSPMHTLLKKSLDHRPDATLLEAWIGYVSDLCKVAPKDMIDSFKTRILGEAQEVAESASGILGLGPKVSNKEQVVLAEMAAAFLP